MDSVILIDKPAGMTSFKVTASVRHKLGIKKAGHDRQGDEAYRPNPR